jgi:hypothetical protein
MHVNLHIKRLGGGRVLGFDRILQYILVFLIQEEAKILAKRLGLFTYSTLAVWGHTVV